MPYTLEPIVSDGENHALYELNETHALELSSVTLEKFNQMVGEAFFATAVREEDVDAAAFMLAFDQGADYDSENFIWFKNHYDRFVYVDRVVAATDHRRQGLANQLYEALFERAKAAGHERVVCEINAFPPNPASDAFHEGLGFVEVGSADLQSIAKSVRYFSKTL